eukprot:4871337-Prymnesium_polylepis.1
MEKSSKQTLVLSPLCMSFSACTRKSVGMFGYISYSSERSSLRSMSPERSTSNKVNALFRRRGSISLKLSPSA